MHRVMERVSLGWWWEEEVSGQASRREGSLKESTWISPGIRKQYRRRL